MCVRSPVCWARRAGDLSEMCSHAQIEQGIGVVETFLLERLRPMDSGARLAQEVIDGILAAPPGFPGFSARGGYSHPPTCVSSLCRRGSQVGTAALPDA